MRSLAGKIKISKRDYNSLTNKQKKKNLSKPKSVNKKIKNLRAIAFSLLLNIRDIYLFLFLKHMIG